MIENIDNKNNGIVRIATNGTEYIFWKHTDVVRKYIKGDLKNRFPNKLIVREISDIDYVIPEINLPVEIQSTILNNGRGVAYKQWEDRIRGQIEQNIINYGGCLFYFDSELLRAMKSAGHCISINMDWFRTFIKDEKLIVNTISHNGIVEAKQYKDFDFIVNISQSCPIAAEKDGRILNDNKLKILANALKFHSFTQEEIDRFEDGYEKSDKDDVGNYIYTFLIKQPNGRSKLYGKLLKSIGHLESINKAFDGYIVGNNFLQNGVSLGIFESEGTSGGKHNHLMRFVNNSMSSLFFPAYMRHKDTWDEFKGKWLVTKRMEYIVKGNIDQKSIDPWS